MGCASSKSNKKQQHLCDRCKRIIERPFEYDQNCKCGAEQSRNSQEDYAAQARNALRSDVELYEMSNIESYIAQHHQTSLDQATRHKIIDRVIIDEFLKQKKPGRSKETVEITKGKRKKMKTLHILVNV